MVQSSGFSLAPGLLGPDDAELVGLITPWSLVRLPTWSDLFAPCAEEKESRYGAA